MKKSLLALFLALVMCLSLFCTACSSSGDEENPDVLNTSESDIAPMTITLYAPTNSTTTKDQVKLVEAEFNKVTEAKFNTHVVFNLIPEDDYEEVIYSRLEGLRKQAAAELEDETKKPNVTPLSDNSKYPGIKDNQLDIFLVNTFETYYALATGTYYKPENNELPEGALYPLDESLKEKTTLLNSYAYPYLLRAARIDDLDTGTQGVFGVFNNTIFGEYQYLLLNKELVDKYNYDPENMFDLSSISLFLKEVKQNEAGVIPFLGDLEAPVEYFNGTKSLIGAYVGKDYTSSGTINATSYLPAATAPNNLFNSAEYRVWMREYNSLFNAGCFVAKTDANANSKFAATVVTGDVTLSPTYADVYGNYKVDDYGFKYITYEDGVDYYVSVYKRPVANDENVFKAGYVVGGYTEDADRCMEIIQALNTDAKLANLFMYGVQDVHYTLNVDTNVVHKTTDTYSMDIETVGNMYLLNPSDDMDEYWKFMSANKWQNAKNTNLEAVMSPFLAFHYDPEQPAEDELEAGKVYIDMSFEEVMAEIEKLSPAFYEKALHYVETPELPFADYIKTVYTEVSENEYVSSIGSFDKGMYNMQLIYKEWYQAHYNVKLAD
ncbi:MAG: hypothetical protein E7574_00265 [Ruminococcaceae bacterium]|nr:hypothetical protein [Oscillospiraceae bacterium]